MRFPEINPVFLKIGPLEFRWYGLMYILGFTAAYFLIKRNAERKEMSLTSDDVGDIIFALAIGVILGGRLGYVFFYKFSYYLHEPLKILAVWEGGMSFHGGLLGVIVAGWYYAKKKGLAFWDLTDICVPAVPVGLGLGRIGNFINGELYGRVTDVPWGMVFPGGGSLPRHPSQLYEAFLEGGVLFVLLYLLARKKLPAGALLWAFLGGYGACRFVVEFFREPDEHLHLIALGMSMGQLLSLPMFVVGVAMFMRIIRGKAVGR